jgi:hypothetical protein
MFVFVISFLLPSRMDGEGIHSHVEKIKRSPFEKGFGAPVRLSSPHARFHRAFPSLTHWRNSKRTGRAHARHAKPRGWGSPKGERGGMTCHQYINMHQYERNKAPTYS